MVILGLPVSVVLLYCAAAAVALVYAPFLVVASSRLQVGYDLEATRSIFERLPACTQRATWADRNSLEAFVLFSAAALMVFVTGWTRSRRFRCDLFCGGPVVVFYFL